MRLSPGTRVGDYVVSEPLGAGNMGEVYRARDVKLQRDVALKVLPRALPADDDRLARFRREAQVLASLNHPNIAHIYGLVESGDVLAIAMELVEGVTLDEAVHHAHDDPRRHVGKTGSRAGLPIGEAMAIGRQLAEALEAAHDQGIIHRDLKPANVKVRPDGLVKILDFGIAKVLEPEPAEAMVLPTVTGQDTRQGVVIGTPAYMSPEQARGKPVDRRTDIWAFGAVLYEMLTGCRAFAGDTTSDTLASVLREDVDWTKMPADVPRALEQLLRRCLERDPRQRLRDIGEARIALATPDAADGLSPRHAPPAEPAARGFRLVLFDALSLVAVGAALLLARAWVDVRPAVAARLSAFEYTFLQEVLLPGGNAVPSWMPGDPRIPMVIDISPLRFDRVQPIDRAKLADLVDTLEAMNAAAIGIDIDFSPTDKGYFITTDDGQLFKKWAALGNVRIGVFRHAGDSPDSWLGRPEFRTLAAGILLDMDEPGRAIQYTIPGQNGARPSAPAADYLLQMPAALFEATHPGSRTALVGNPRLQRSSVDDRLFEGSFPIDTGFKSQIPRVPYQDSGDLKNWAGMIQHKVVLIGDMKDVGDARCVQAGPEPVAGVLIHAVSLATLNKGILRAIDDRTSLAYDVLIGLCALATILATRLAISRRARQRGLSATWVRIVAFTAAAVAVFFVGSLAIGIGRMLWPDPLWLAFGILLAPYAEQVARYFVDVVGLLASGRSGTIGKVGYVG
jgi:CHASE2 domain-containing sensor protein